MKIGDLTDHKILSGSHFGIEVEVEGSKLPLKIKGFKVVGEGSLRPVNGDPGVEYVFSKPEPLPITLHHIDTLHTALSEAPLVQFSNRTSVHVHVNTTDLTVAQWFTFLFLWVLYEDALIHFCGEERKGNLFCLSTRDAEGLFFQLENFARTCDFRYLNDELRYCAVNTAATAKYGSVEFRSMRGTSNPVVLKDWVLTLNSLREKAVELGSPQELIQQLISDERIFTENLFPQHHFVYSYPDMYNSLRENAFKCALIIDSCDFNEFDFSDEPRFDI